MMLFKFEKILIFSLLIFNCIAFSNPTKDFEKANQLYKQGNYSEAIIKYEALLNSGIESFDLYYNVGNTYYKLGEIGKSILYYEKAYKLDPTDEDLNFNLSIARNKIIDKIDSVPEFFLYTFFNNIRDNLSLNSWAILTLILFLLSIVFLLNILVFRILKSLKISFLLLVITSIIFTISAFFTGAKVFEYYSKDKAIVIEKIVNVKNSPTAKSSDAFIIHEGLKIRIIEKLEDWYKIKLEDGKTGWIKENSIGII